MRWLVIALLVSLLAGQLAGFAVVPGVTVYLHDVVVLAILGNGFYSGAIKRSLRGSRLVKPIVAFGVVGALSLVANASSVPADVFAKGSLYLLRWLAYAGVYFSLLGSKMTFPWLMRGLFLFGSTLGLVGLIQFFLYPDLRNLFYLGWDPHYYRVFATLLDPNFTGIVLVLAVILGVYFVRDRREIGVIVGIGITMLALLLTYSRSSYLALLSALAAWVVIGKKWNAGVLLGLAFFVAIVYLPRPGREALSLDRFDSTVSRLQNWSQTAQRIGQKPLLGVGFNVLPFKETWSELPKRAGAGVDNSFLFIGVTTGVLGMLAYGWLLWSMVKLGKTVYLASLAALVVHSFFVNSLFYPWVMLWMWLLTAAVEKETSAGR